MAEVLTTRQARAMLKAIGFDNADRAFVAAVKGFQRGWNLGDPLDDDGVVGELTSKALRKSYARGQDGLSTMSAHFSYVEFRCKCGGRFAECQRIWMLRIHIRRLEAYRAEINAPVRIVSGCRCRGHNSAVGGASASQHMFGVACDIEGLRSLQEKKKLQRFAGLGFKQSTGKVIHVDSRDKGGHNNGGTPLNPVVWKYAS